MGTFPPTTITTRSPTFGGFTQRNLFQKFLFLQKTPLHLLPEFSNRYLSTQPIARNKWLSNSFFSSARERLSPSAGLLNLNFTPSFFISRTSFLTHLSANDNSVYENARYSPGFGQSLVNGDIMAQSHQVKGCRKSCGPGTYNGNPFSGRRKSLFNQIIVDFVLFSELVHGICQVSVDFALRNRLIQHFTTATHLAMEVANPSYRVPGRGIIAQRKLKGFLLTRSSLISSM
jgi:hypothetical protein